MNTKQEQSVSSGDNTDTQTPAQTKNAERNSPQNTHNSFLWEVIKFALLALIIVVPVRLYIASPFIVSGNSMEPTFATGHYLIVDQLSYRFDDPERGDVIVFKYPNDTSKFFIKRIIGLPKETVNIQNGSVMIINDTLPGGFPLNEEYIDFPKNDALEITLKEDEYFVMGDNRASSSDSRVWGPLNERFIVGRALLRLLPVSKIDIDPGEIIY